MTKSKRSNTSKAPFRFRKTDIDIDPAKPNAISRRTFLKASAVAATSAAALTSLPKHSLARAQASQAHTADGAIQAQVGVIGEIPPDGDPQPILIRITPSEGLLSGGATVTLTGANFLPGIEVYFGDTASAQVTYVNAGTLQVQVPSAQTAGPVDVTAVNPDGGSDNLPNSFTYVGTEQAVCARISDVEPELVLADTISEVVLRGRNLIQAYNEGLVAFRTSERANIELFDMRSERDEASQTDSLFLNLRITGTPALESHERMVVQVIASCRREARNDLVVETSRAMFTVVSSAEPVPMAHTANLVPGRENLVMVVGKNLKGCSLAFGETKYAPVEPNHSYTDDDMLVMSVAIAKDAPVGESLPLRLRNEKGSDIGSYDIQLKESLKETSDGVTLNALPPESPLAVTLTHVPGQKLIEVPQTGARVFDLAQRAYLTSTFGIPFPIQVVNISILIPIIRFVRMIPFFDGGNSDTPGQNEPLGVVGRLLRLRASGLLIAIHVEIRVHISVIVILTYYPGFSFFNEYADFFPYAFGTITIHIFIEIEIQIIVSFLTALVLPNGQLRVLFSFLLVINVHFTISSDGHTLQFGNFHHRVNMRNIHPFGSFTSCGSNVRLVEDGGQNHFADPLGWQAFYFPSQEGSCCLSWQFDFDLVRFAPGQPETTIQRNYVAQKCLSFVPASQYLRLRVISEPPPTGVPVTLRMEITDTALLKTFGQYVTRNGTPIGQEFELLPPDFQVAYKLGNGTEILDPGSLQIGQAFAIQEGKNRVFASLAAPEQGEALWAFFPEDLDGFEILQLVSGLLPRVRVNIPLRVVVSPTQRPFMEITFRAPDPLTRQQPYSNPVPELAIYYKVTRIENIASPQQITLKARDFVLAPHFPLEGLFETNSSDCLPTNLERAIESNPERFYYGDLLTSEYRVPIDPSRVNEGIIPIGIAPNHVEQRDAQGHLNLVPWNGVQLLMNMTATPQRPETRIIIRRPQIILGLKHDESAEEYYRVTLEAQQILAASPLRDFAREQIDRLFSSPPTATKMAVIGQDLWSGGREAVQNGQMDDRALFFARLQFRAAFRNTFPAEVGLLPYFERASRNLDPTTGAIQTYTTPDTTQSIILTGFDPFYLRVRVNQSNTSGLAVLKLSDEIVIDRPDKALVAVTILPVLYSEFDQRIVESAVGPHLNSAALAITLSDGDEHYYEVERFATRWRVGNKDNDLYEKSPGHAPGLSGASEYLENRLPYRRVITGPNLTLPTTPVAGVTPDFIVLDQSFKHSGASNQLRDRALRPNGQRPPPQAGVFFSEPISGEEDVYWPIVDRPSLSPSLVEGSGGSYFSNEVFFRMMRERQRLNSNVTAGHVHIPDVKYDGVDLITKPVVQSLFAGVREMVTNFYQRRSGLKPVADLVFPSTLIGNRLDRFVDIQNEDAPITITSAVLAGADSPFIVGGGVFIGRALSPGQSFRLQISFNPNEVGPVTDTITLRGIYPSSASEVPLLQFRVRGMGRERRGQDASVNSDSEIETHP